jgi:hypothetical protein
MSGISVAWATLMKIDNLPTNTQAIATATTTPVEHARHLAPAAQSQSQSTLRDPGERMLASDAWRGTPVTERSLSNGPHVPTLANTDLLQAVDHAVKFVMGHPS